MTSGPQGPQQGGQAPYGRPVGGRDAMLDGQHEAASRFEPPFRTSTEETTVTSVRLSRAIVVAALTGLVAATTACGPEDESSAAPASTPATSSSSTAALSSAASSAGPFGPACAEVPTAGPGSFAAMATEPVAVAASQNPLLSDLAQAVIAANLVDVLNTRGDVTVLAPANLAFQAVDPAARNALMVDVPRLTTLLTHHVLPGRLTSDQLVGEHTTLNGDKVTIGSSGTDLTISADQTLAGAAPATVLCGDVQTANATVYVIDQVLAPPVAG